MRKLLVLILMLLMAASVNAGTVTGQVQNPQLGPVANGTFTFTLTQAALVSGSASIAASSVSCFTDQNGNVVGEPNPLVVPVLSTNLASGTLAAGTYFVRLTYFDGTGESFAGPEGSIVLASQGTLIVTAPVKQPASASGYKVYISSSTGTETQQGLVTGTPGSWANFSQSVVLVSGAALPASNTTACKLRFNDELQPSFVCYDVGLASSTGVPIPGYPQYFYLAGGSGGTVNLSLGTPQSNVCQGSGVVYPQAILTTPAFNGLQSINGPLSLNGFGLFNVGSISGPVLTQANINLACNGTTPGFFWLPLGVSSGVPALTIPANCTVACPEPLACQMTAASTINGNFVSTSGSNVTIDGVVIDGNVSGNPTGGSGVVDNAGSHFLLQNSRIQNTTNHGFRYSGVGADDVVVRNNTFLNIGGTGVNPQGGSAILFGNTPASQGGVDSSLTNCKAQGNHINVALGQADGIFSLGEVASTGYGIVGCDFSGNTINGVQDTSIEVGVGSQRITVSHNTIDVPVTFNGAVGISARSASNVDISGNTVICHGGTAQDGIFSWHNTAGPADPPVNQFVNIAGNTVTGCNPNAGSDIQANSGDNTKISGNNTDGGAASYVYGGTVTNLFAAGNDDGTWQSNIAMDFTIAPKSANFLHIVTAGTGKTGVGVASFTPNALFEIQSGSGGPDLRITQTGNNNVGFSLVNTSQRTDFTIRATASGLCTVNESVVWRDTTGGADLFCIAPVSGNSIFLGNVKLPSLNMTQALLLSGTQPTIAGAGCGGSAASIGTSNGTASFVVNVGTAPTTACTVTMPTASNGWNCYATDISTNSTTVFLQKQTATGASSITITNFNDVAVGANFSANDVLQVSCFAR